MMLAACSGKAPKGQVLAVVNGQEVTVQDLASEARARKLGGRVNQPALLQEVVARTLLAQSAHARKLDGDPGYPADVKRLQQTFLAEKELAADVKPAAPPTAAQIQAFIDKNPQAFAQRTRFSVDMLRYQPGPAQNAIGTPPTLDLAIAKLKSLNVTYEQRKQVLDSISLPLQLTQRLQSSANGQFTEIQQGQAVLGLVVDARAQVTATPEQQTALARQLLMQGAAQRQINGVVGALRAKAKIAYQAGFAPPAPSAPANKTG